MKFDRFVGDRFSIRVKQTAPDRDGFFNSGNANLQIDVVPGSDGDRLCRLPFSGGGVIKRPERFDVADYPARVESEQIGPRRNGID